MTLDPGLVGLISAILIALGTWGALRQAKKVDKRTEAATLAAGRNQEVAQVIDGLNRIVENLQEDNKVLRESLTASTVKLDQAYADRDAMRVLVETFSTRVDDCIAERDTLRGEIARMSKLLAGGGP